MSVSKVKHKYQTILDFSDQHLTKTKIKRSLSSVIIQSLYKSDNNILSDEMICIENEIKVGMYKICLILSPSIQRFTNHKLKDFGNFTIQLYELNKTPKEINLKKDNRFKEQSWTNKLNLGLKVNDLANIICYCQRLDKLKAFL